MPVSEIQDLFVSLLENVELLFTLVCVGFARLNVFTTEECVDVLQNSSSERQTDAHS